MFYVNRFLYLEPSFGTYMWTLFFMYVEASSAERLSVTECAAGTFILNLYVSWPVEPIV